MINFPDKDKYSYFKRPLRDEISLIYKPAFLPRDPKKERFTSIVSRLSCVFGAVITVCIFPFEETYHLANTIKKITAFPFYLFSFMGHCLVAQDINKIDNSRIILGKRWSKLIDSIAHSSLIPFIRVIFVARLLAAAILHPRIAY